MFSSIKMEEYMESELSGIFPVKLATKNIERGSPGTQFMHVRVKKQSWRFLTGAPCSSNTGEVSLSSVHVYSV